MLFPELNSVKARRARLSIGQKELANLAGVSQSLIAKLEKGKLEPSYGVAVKLFLALERLEHKNEKKCFEIMTKKIIFVSKNDKISKVAEMMKKSSISQVPVLDNGKIIGSISESMMFSKVLEIPKKELFNMKVEDIMQEPYPIVNSEMPISVVIPMLKNSDAILVNSGKELRGIITKANLI